MSVDRFTTQQFRDALINLEFEVGDIYEEMGEICFDLPYRGVAIHIRSSIGSNGVSGDTGENSIRLYMRLNREYLGKIDAYTTRVKGWAGRLSEKIWELQKYRDLSGDCSVCGEPLAVFRVKKEGPNHGRLFATCKKDDVFVWLDEQNREPIFGLDVAKIEETSQVIDIVGVDVGSKESTTEIVVVENGQVIETFSLAQILNSLPEDEVTQGLGDPSEFQTSVIEAPLDQPIRVLAAPGSGKTFTISHRYAYMVKELGINPHDIVVVTFNKLAAENMLKKIVEQCPIPPEAMNQICTIHALCNRTLRNYYKSFSGLNMAKDWTIEKILKGLMINLEPVEDVRPGWEEMYSWITTSKAHGIIPQDVAEWFTRLNPDVHHSMGALLQACRTGLDEALRAEKTWTFIDMLYEMEQALKHDPDFKRNWQNRFKYLIVDEAQDTAAQAIRILTALFDHTEQIMMVGDGDQLLYRFTGATPENTLYEGFDKRYPSNYTYMLPINYRSTQKIVEYSTQVILNNYQPVGDYDQRFFKAVSARPDAEIGPDLAVLYSPNPIAEAHSIVEQVKHMLADGRDPGDFFVAARTRAQIGYLEAAFAPSDIPYVNVVGSSFFDLPHIKHVLSYMQLTADPTNETAFANIYNVASSNMKVPWSTAPDYGAYCQHRFLTAEFLSAAKHLKGMFILASFHASIKPKASWKFGMQDLMDLMYELQASAEDGPVSVVDAIIDNCYKKYVTSQSGSEEGTGEGGRLDDIATIRELAGNFTSLQDFIQFADNVIAASRAAQNKDWAGRVVLATIHRLKGLERPVVIGVGISEGADEEIGLLPHTFALVDPPNNGKMPGNHKGQIADERCLFFVLISRAQHFIILSSIDLYREKRMKPSRFIGEVTAVY